MGEAESGVTQPQAKEFPEQQKMEEAREDFLLESVNKCCPMDTWFQTSILQNCEATHFSYFSHSVYITGLDKKFV